MARKTFFKLIRCRVCEQNFVAISDRKVQKYLCGSYSRKLPNSCSKTRYTVNEEDLLYMIQIYCNRNKIEMIESNEFMKSIIDKIFINRNEDSIEIYYKNGERAIHNTKQSNI